MKKRFAHHRNGLFPRPGSEGLESQTDGSIRSWEEPTASAFFHDTARYGENMCAYRIASGYQDANGSPAALLRALPLCSSASHVASVRPLAAPARPCTPDTNSHRSSRRLLPAVTGTFTFVP